MIFKTFERIDKRTGNVSTGVGLGFGNFKKDGFTNAKTGQATTNAYYSRKALAVEAAGLNEVARANAAYNKVLAKYNAGKATAVELSDAKRIRDERAIYASNKYGEAVQRESANLNYSNKDVKKHIADKKALIDANQKAAKSFAPSTKAMLGNIGTMLAISVAIQAVMKAWNWANKEFGLTAELNNTPFPAGRSTTTFSTYLLTQH